MVHRKRPDLIRDPARVLAALRACRTTMIETTTAVKPMGVMYQGLGMVVAAIDARNAPWRPRRLFLGDGKFAHAG
jgi:hypothetical protein